MTLPRRPGQRARPAKSHVNRSHAHPDAAAIAIEIIATELGIGVRSCKATLELARYVVLNPVRAGVCAMPDQWRWSSYLAMVGQAHRPNWLHTEWLLLQFGNQYAKAVAAYTDPVRAGVGLPSMWDALQDQLYLGDEAFADKSRQKLSNRLLNDSEIPRLQRRARVAPLSVFAAMHDRNSAIAKAYSTGRYSQKEIAQAFGIHYATVSRIVKAKALLPADGQT